MGMLNGKIAVITGASRGFGLAIAQAYASEGASLLIASRSENAINEAVNILRESGAIAAGYPTDVRNINQVEALAANAKKIYGHFDIWINNAALSAPYGPTMDIAPDTFNDVIQTNIHGVYYGSIMAMRHFISRNQGKLINILGRGDRQPVPMQNAYASSKTWIHNFTLALAKENRKSRIGIYLYNPGLMETDLLENIEVITGYEDRLKPMATIMRMWAKSPKIPAQRAVWLASASTDGRSGLVIRELGFSQIIVGALKEGLNRLLRKHQPERERSITSVPSSNPTPSKADQT
jgi:NAD(P)-dependent dehydrogenase (short-subunit alcohol dehydrogenase family)